MRPLVLIAPGGARIALADATVIGAGAEADLLVDAPQVEQRHARIEREAEGWAIRALDGEVRIDGEAVERALLRPGDTFAIGCASFRVDAARFRLQAHRALPIAVGLGALVVFCAILLAHPADPDAAVPRLQVVPNRPTIRWQGESAAVVLEIPVVDPERSLVELAVQAPDHPGTLVLSAHGNPIDRIAGSARRTISLRGHLRAGENRLDLLSADGVLRALELRAIATPVPDCRRAACEAPLHDAMARAERLEREREAAPPNLFEAWRWWRRARAFAIGLGDAAAGERIELRLRAVESALDERCAALEFAAARHLALQDPGGARGVAEELLRAFPTDEHGCRHSGERLLALLGDGGS